MAETVLDTRKVMTGKDGQLYVTLADGTSVFLAEVDTFQAQANFSNTDLQPVGSYQVMAVPISYAVTLTFTETVIRDNVMLKPIFDALKDGYMPYFDFQGKLKRRDGAFTREVFRDCIPDGSVDLMNLTPGDIIKRAWSFRVNQVPDLQEFITDNSY